mgnify:CR=1 FL=1
MGSKNINIIDPKKNRITIGQSDEEIKKFIKMSESKILKIVDAAEQTIKDNYLLDHQVNKMMQIYKDLN